MLRGTPSQVQGGVPHPGLGGFHTRSRGYPIPGLWGGTPSQVGGTLSQVWGSTPSQVQGVPHPRSRGTPSRPGWGGGGGTLSWPARGTPPGQTWDGVPPSYPDLRWGTPPYIDLGLSNPLPRPGLGYPPSTQTWDGVSPPPEMWTDKQTENSTFPHPSDAGGKNPVKLKKFWSVVGCTDGSPLNPRLSSSIYLKQSFSSTKSQNQMRRNTRLVRTLVKKSARNNCC